MEISENALYGFFDPKNIQPIDFFLQFAIVPGLALQMKSVTKMTDDVFAQKVSTGSNVNLEVSKRSKSLGLLNS